MSALGVTWKRDLGLSLLNRLMSASGWESLQGQQPLGAVLQRETVRTIVARQTRRPCHSLGDRCHPDCRKTCETAPCKCHQSPGGMARVIDATPSAPYRLYSCARYQALGDPRIRGYCTHSHTHKDAAHSTFALQGTDRALTCHTRDRVGNSVSPEQMQMGHLKWPAVWLSWPASEGGQRN